MIARLPSRSIEHHMPAHVAQRRREIESGWHIARVTKKKEMAVCLAVHIGKCMTYEHADAASFRVVPVGRHEFVPVAVPPTDILVLVIGLARTFQECVAPQARRTTTKRNERANKIGEGGIRRRLSPI